MDFYLKNKTTNEKIMDCAITSEGKLLRFNGTLFDELSRDDWDVVNEKEETLKTLMGQLNQIQNKLRVVAS